MYARLYHSQNNEEAACLRHLPIFMSGQANIYHLNLNKNSSPRISILEVILLYSDF